MDCPGCGKVVPPNYDACPWCGVKVPQVEAGDKEGKGDDAEGGVKAD